MLTELRTWPLRQSHIQKFLSDGIEKQRFKLLTIQVEFTYHISYIISYLHITYHHRSALGIVNLSDRDKCGQLHSNFNKTHPLIARDYIAKWNDLNPVNPKSIIGGLRFSQTWIRFTAASNTRYAHNFVIKLEHSRYISRNLNGTKNRPQKHGLTCGFRCSTNKDN